MSIFKFLFELQSNDKEENQSDLDKSLLALSMYIHFNYEKIVSDPQMIDFLVNSERVLNKFHSIYFEYNRRQIESIFIAFNLLLLIGITNMYKVDNLD